MYSKEREIPLNRFRQHVDSLTKAQKASLKFYTSSDYKELNENIRGGRVRMMPPQSQNHFSNIMEAMKSGPMVDSVITVYRGMNTHYDVFQNKGLLSTSFSKKSAMRFAKDCTCCLYIINLTPGQYTILPISSISEFPDEEEILLPPGSLSVQRVVPCFSPTNTDNIDTIYCTYIPGNAEIVSINELNQRKFDELKIKISTDAWIQRITDTIDEDEMGLYDASEDDPVIFIESVLRSLPFYASIPNEFIVDKLILSRLVELLLNSENPCS